MFRTQQYFSTRMASFQCEVVGVILYLDNTPTA
eukprot:jgi/Botrbrau1/14529/Bobra.0235s0001.1